ncbi:hypothetical protein RBSWK_06017 [Rhodopirellula baltica SWK14]|nr:hypothetical protein RBSWK_06017 [Rhodopirellula baltica SWK14]
MNDVGSWFGGHSSLSEFLPVAIESTFRFSTLSHFDLFFKKCVE